MSEFKADRNSAKGYSARKEEDTMLQIGGISESVYNGEQMLDVDSLFASDRVSSNKSSAFFI